MAEALVAKGVFMKVVSFLFVLCLSLSAFSADIEAPGQTNSIPCLRSAESNDRTPVTEKSDLVAMKKKRKQTAIVQ
jgi:hypothetical protein